MKHTKANIIKLLKVRSRLAYRLYKAGMSEGHIYESMAFDTCVRLLTNKKFFEGMTQIHMEKA